MQGFWPAHGCIWTYESNETQISWVLQLADR
jgi:hypothetical protein